MSARERRSGPGHHSETAETSKVTTTVVVSSVPRPSDSGLPSGVSPWWWSVVIRAIAMAACSGLAFDARLLRSYGVPDPQVPQHWGVAMAACAARNMIEATGTAAVATRDDGRQVAVRQWRGTAEFRSEAAREH